MLAKNRFQQSVEPLDDPFGDMPESTIDRSDYRNSGDSLRSASGVSFLQEATRDRSIIQQDTQDQERDDSRPRRITNPMQDPMQDTLPNPMQDTLPNPMPGGMDEVLKCEKIREILLGSDVRDIQLTTKIKANKIIQYCEFEGNPTAPRCWAPQTFVWTASGICTKPLYFQHIQLERYGHSRGPIMQPIISAAHFFGNVAFYPYKAAIHPPNECVYVLGYYRPGDCAPWLREPFPFAAPGFVGNARGWGIRENCAGCNTGYCR